MLELTLVRDQRRECCTGTLFVRDENGDIIFFCNTLEHITREVKIKGKTGIPHGTYEIEFAPSQKFKKVMPYLRNVPNFTGIMIHPGNTLKDTQGCILVGKAFGTALVESRTTFEKLLNIILQDPIGLKITITTYGKETH